MSEFWKLWLTAKRLGVTLLFALTFSSWAQTPLPRAHSHNDYEQPRPLQDALAQGFGSVEADIWLVNGELLVAHDLKDAKPDRTLETLYLDPLRERARTNGGRIYPGGGEFTLLVDIKSEADPTYAALRPRLIKYRDLLTRFTDSNVTPAAVTVILSGARPIAEVRAEPERWCAIDGRLADLESNPSRFLFPLVSDSWRPMFSWFVDGKLPANEQARLRELVQTAHAQGRRIRFWGVQDQGFAWCELRDSGVDLINTDKLVDLGSFLRTPDSPKK
ncbi:MAG TPA: phosphatidylinositol-specific phospholipase C/glycerophosphodiester phosphodiesterase family protein [Verrucomicrobiota bacterium]|nr:phosphatidylinositol-specific phospholipase C/glycerophosphodiester phosphodiesterase family protein [Verrucomicrobiota bacterium]